MEIKLREAADLVGGIIIGNADLEFSNVSRIQEAQKGDLTFLYLPTYEKYLDTTKASAVIIKPEIKKTRNDITYLEVTNPEVAFQNIINEYFTPELKLSGIDPSASIDQSSSIGKNTAIGKNVVISSGCKIGNNTKIFHNTVLMDDVEIGSDCIIYPNVSVREDCKVGNNVIIHCNTVIGSDGFGYSPDDNGVYKKISQIGNVILEDDVELGSNVSIDRSALGSTVIKKGTKIDNLVQIAHNVTVGENTAISAQAGISGSTKIGNNCILAGQVGLVGHIELVDKVIVGAQSGVSKSITKPGIYFGSPAKELRKSKVLEVYIRQLPELNSKIKELEKQVKFLNDQLNNKNEVDS